MRRDEVVLRGQHVAAGFILNPGLAGVANAQRRVLEHWVAGSRLHLLPDGQWFLSFAEPRELDATGSGANLVIQRGDGLAALDTGDVVAGELNWVSAGEHHEVTLGSLETLDPSAWIDLGPAVRVLHPTRVQADDTGVKAVQEIERVEKPDLRKAASIGAISQQSTRMLSELHADANAHNRRRALGRSGKSGSGPGRQRNGALESLVSRAVLKSPFAGRVGLRHRRYFDDLQRKFITGDFDEALRRALPLNGLGAAGMTLRLPRRRNDLNLSHQAGQVGAALPVGPTLRDHLTQVYRDAAERLEAAGRIDEAAFVHLELLNNVMGCIGLLERHDEFETAASIAESRHMSVEMVIRLWWLADKRDRALLIARRHHAYAQVVKLLHKDDPEQAREFRLRWVDDLERGGNIAGAIAVGWADPELRPFLINTVRRGVRRNDRWALGLRSHLLALEPTEQTWSEFRSELLGREPTAEELRFLVASTTQAVCPDERIDRELCSILLRMAAPHASRDRSFERETLKLNKRADPLLAVDRPPTAKSDSSSEPITIPAAAPGALTVHDVFPLAGGTCLVALGWLGTRLVDASGSTIREWPIPCHHLVGSDHGTRALLLANRGDDVDVVLLDLERERHSSYGTIRTSAWATSFDGMTWPVVDQRGIAFLDLLSDTPIVAWRELNKNVRCLALERSPDSLCALVFAPKSPEDSVGPVDMWKWRLPERRLDDRKRIHRLGELAWREDPPLVLCDGIALRRAEGAVPALFGIRSDPSSSWLLQGTAIAASQDVIAMQDRSGMVAFHRPAVSPTPLATWDPQGDTWGFRADGQRLAMWSNGSLTVIDLAEQSISTRASINE